ncbi:hypothetical protein [Caballeronia sp. ATUFL_F2_KS9A]|uniref:hypothetical protein n=1 Tax=Caballeronia sp. ATUFL_F2_KS9A TaxID=2921777 RepID=UPI0020277A3B|nr:hypothetical protein [Caballeronia sp. ATUFL_F2_KS9A]
MSCIFFVGLRDDEMVEYDSTFNVWNGRWGLNNQGGDPVTIDANDGAIAIKTKGLYRVSGLITGIAAPSTGDNDLVRVYINLPPDQLERDPSYPDPYYFGSQTKNVGGRTTLPFSGHLVLTTWPKFTFYVSKNFRSLSTNLLFEYVQQ